MASIRDEQTSALKFCFRLKKSATEAYDLLQEAYGEDVLPRSTVYRWFKDYQNGRQTCIRQPGPGAPISAVTEVAINTAAVIVREDRRITQRRLADILDISKGSVQTIMHEHLHMTRVCARWVPRLLTPLQKEVRVETCLELKRLASEHGEAFINSVITADETWLHHYDPESKQQSSIWKSPSFPTAKKAKVVASAGKVMVISFFDSNGMIYQHVVPPHTTVTGVYYVEVLKTLRTHIRRKRPRLHLNGWRLHHDNARPHVANVVAQYLASVNVSCVPHPPYSPDLAPCDFFLFPKLKEKLKGRRFESSEAVVKAAEAALKLLTRDGLSHVFQEWQRRWQKCIVTNGDYFEKDHLKIQENP